MAYPDNQKLARIFEEMGSFLEMAGENQFKVAAYGRAARALQQLAQPLTEVYASGELARTPGFGKALLDKVRDYLESGEVRQHSELKAGYPPHILELTRVPGLGARKAAQLHAELGVGSVAELEAALNDGRVKTLKGFGAKSADKIREGLVQLKAGSERWTLARAQRLADDLIERLRALPDVSRVDYAGSLRRGQESVGDLDLIAVTTSAEAVGREFASWVEPDHVVAAGDTKTSVLWMGRFQVDLRCVPAESHGAALQYFTGSQDHNVALRGRARRMDLELNEYGLFQIGTRQRVPSATEEQIYRSLGLPYIEPEQRQSGSELILAERGQLPAPLHALEIRGNLHTHSTWSDGSDTLDQLVEEAMKRGMEYLAVTDHSRSLVIANGLSIERLLQQGEEIRRINDRLEGRFRLLWGSECDILADGSLDYPDEILAQLDWVVASVHTLMTMDPVAMTERLQRAASHPCVDVIGHPSGRVLGKRAGYVADWEAVFATAQEHGVALEMNASPHRLDLNDSAARRAREVGCKLSINTDAHSLREFDNVRWGLMQARRAGLVAADIINTQTRAELLSRRPRAVSH